MTTSYTVPDDPKMLRETLCLAQVAVQRHDGMDVLNAHHIARIGRLIAECDRHRPLGPNGKHGDRHTATCGCEDVPGSALTPAELADAQPRQPGEKPCSNLSCPLVFAHRGPCAPPGPAQHYGAELLLDLADEAQRMADQGIERLLNTTLAQMLRVRARVIVTATQGRTPPFGVI